MFNFFVCSCFIFQAVQFLGEGDKQAAGIRCW